MHRAYRYLNIILLASLIAGCRATMGTDETDEPLATHSAPTVTQAADEAATPSQAAVEITPTLAESPTSTVDATATPPLPDWLYVVAYLAYDDVLNVRSGPGVQNEVVGTLQNNRLVEVMAGPEIVDGDTWVLIKAVPEYDGDISVEGWVNRFYLAQQMRPLAFCDDTIALGKIADLITAVRMLDGAFLAELVSPVRGLYIGDADLGVQVHLSHEEVSRFFTSTTVYDWGTNGYTGEPVRGTITEIMLPELVDALTNEGSQRACNLQLEDKLLAHLPIEVSDFRWWVEQSVLASPGLSDVRQDMYSIVRPSTPDGGFDYIGWAIGIEYWDGVPYINALITYGWIA